MTTIPFINGKQHAWASIRANILGRVPTGITAISYGNKRTKENLYGAGSEPIARGEGNNEYDPPKLEMMSFEVEGIQNVAPLRDITSIPPFDIIIEFKETLGSPKVTHIIQNCEFTNNVRDMKQGDTKVSVALDLICAGIKW